LGLGRGRRDAFVDELRFLDDALRGRRFLAGDGPGLADVAYAPFVERLEAALGAHRGGSVRDISHAHNLARVASWLDALDGVSAYAATKCAGAGEIAAVYRPRATRRMSYLRQ
jgi:glutathione S-transferase